MIVSILVNEAYAVAIIFQPNANTARNAKLIHNKIMKWGTECKPSICSGHTSVFIIMNIVLKTESRMHTAQSVQWSIDWNIYYFNNVKGMKRKHQQIKLNQLVNWFLLNWGDFEKQLGASTNLFLHFLTPFYK